MRQQWWSYYDKQSGELSRMQLFETQDVAEKNAPAGHGMIPGRHNNETHLIDVSSATPVKRSQPRQLSDWESRRDAFLRIAAIERTAGPRALREAVLATVPDGPQRQRLADLDSEIASIAVKAGLRKPKD